MSRSRAGLLLVAAAAALLLPGLGAIDLWEPDEPRIAQVAEELRAAEHGRASLVLLHLNGEPYTQKPPLYYWMAAALGAPGGRVSEVAARLPSALAGIATLALVTAFGMRWLGTASGLLGGALLLSTWEFAYLARRAQLDVVLALFETLALVAFLRIDRGQGRRAANAALLHAALGLAVLTKGPVGFLVPLAAAAAWLAWERRLVDLRRAVPAWALLLSLGPGLAWLAAASAAAPGGFLGEAVGENVFGRFFAGTSHDRPFYYYAYQYPVDCLPWTILWVAVWRAGRRQVFGAGGDPELRSRWRFLLAWIGASLLFFSLSAGKRGLYLVPTLPAMALLCADAVRLEIAALHATPRWIGIAAAVFGLLLALGAVALAAVGGVGSVPVPARFAAAVVGAVAITALAWRALRDAPLARVASLAAGAAAIELAAFTLLFPALDPGKSPRSVAEAAAARSAPGEPIGLVGDEPKAPGFAYYSGRRIVNLQGPDEIRRFLADGGRTLLVRRKKLDRVEAVTPVEVRAAVRGDEERQYLVVEPRADGAAAGPT